MSRKRFEQLPEARREEILGTAARAFAKDGFGGTSYNSLLAELGLGKSSAYYYFADKEDLFLTAVQACYQRFFESIGDLPRPGSPEAFWQLIADATERGMQFMLEDPTSAALMQSFVREQRGLGVLASSQVLDSVERYYVELLELGRSLGAVRKDLPQQLLLDVARALSAAFDQWFIAHGQGLTPAKVRKLAGQFSDMTRRLLQP
jgi:AcrR family transcriptional regulator